MTTRNPPTPKSGRWYALGRTIAARIGAKASNSVTSQGSLRYHGPSVRAAVCCSKLVSDGSRNRRSPEELSSRRSPADDGVPAGGVPSVRACGSTIAWRTDLESFRSWRALMGMRISRTGPAQSKRVAHGGSAREWTEPRCRGAQARMCPGHGHRLDLLGRSISRGVEAPSGSTRRAAPIHRLRGRSHGLALPVRCGRRRRSHVDRSLHAPSARAVVSPANAT